MTISPTSDLDLNWTPAVIASQPTLVADLSLSASGDAAQVVGPARLQQDIAWMLMVPVGGYFALPQWGNRFWAEVGRPTAASDEVYLAMAEATEAEFIHQQAIEAAQGFLDVSEQVDSFTATSIDRSVPGRVSVGITVRTRAGATFTVNQPFTD